MLVSLCRLPSVSMYSTTYGTPGLGIGTLRVLYMQNPASLPYPIPQDREKGERLQWSGPGGTAGRMPCPTFDDSARRAGRLDGLRRSTADGKDTRHLVGIFPGKGFSPGMPRASILGPGRTGG